MEKGKNKINLSLAIIISLVGAICLALVMNFYLDSSMASRQESASIEKLDDVAVLIEDMNETASDETDAFDKLNLSKANTIAYMAQNVSNFEYSDSHMEELREIIDVYNLMIVDHNNNIICSSNGVTDTHYFWIGNSAVDPFTIEDNGLSLRYYCSKIDDNTMVVSVRNTEVLDQKISAIASLDSTLSTVKVGQEGFVFALDSDYVLIYYPDSDLIGNSASSVGINTSLIQNDTSNYVTINGETYFCTTDQFSGDYYVCAVPQSELTANKNVTIGIALTIYLIAVAVMILYAYYASNDSSMLKDPKFKKDLGGRLIGIATVSIVVIALSTYFMMTLFSLSRQSITNKHRLNETLETLETAAYEKDYISDQFDESYLEKAHLLGKVIEEMGDDNLTLEFMQGLAKNLDAERIRYFDLNGNTVAANEAFWGLQISKDEDDQTYEFNKILDGTTDEIVQDAMIGDDGDYYQYVGVAILDENYKTKGVAQLGVKPSRLENELALTSLSDVLSGIKTGNNGFVFAVDSNTELFTYYPDESLIGWEATSYGLNENQLVTGYNDFITVNNESYYSLSGEYNDNLIFIAVPMSTINNMSLPIALVASGISLVWLIVLLAVLQSNINKLNLETSDNSNNEGNSQVIDVDRGDGKKVRTSSILSRFSTRGISFKDLDAGQKVWFIFKTIIGIFAIILLIMLMNADTLFSEDSLIRYILNGSWQKGINIFAITQCLIIIIAVEVISILVRKALMFVADKLGAKGNTIIRLVVSFIKMITIVGLIYVCLSQLGADTSVLLTSAGILSLVVGLGANSLIKDMLAGLMIIFEGTFQVGDIVTVGGFRGTVVEIGIITTKVKEGGGNIKIFNNSNLGDVLNMTKDFSIVAVDMSIEYGEDLQYVENVLASAFPKIKNDLPAIKDGPFYKGVSELGDNSVNLKIVAKCDEKDRIQLDRDLRRELKLVFDKNNINIPFPQVVLNQPITEFHHANYYEKEVADEFKDVQNEESKDVFVEDK